MKIILALSMILFLLPGCSRPTHHEKDFFYYQLYSHVTPSWGKKNSSETDNVINRPPRVKIELARFFNSKNECTLLSYQIPSLDNREKGILFLESGCGEEKKLLAKLPQITQLNFTIGRHLLLNTNYKGKELLFKVPLLNLNREKPFSLLTSSSELNYWQGVYVSLGEPAKDFAGLGNRNDSFSEHTATICHDINDNCQEKSANNCEQCRFGYYQVVGKSNCTAGHAKYCGYDNCGQKGWPACLRKSLPENDLEIICVDNNPFVFCSKGLSVYCVNNQLICL